MTGHGQARRPPAWGAVVDRQFFTAGDRSSRGDVIRTDMPEVRVTTVIAEMDRAAGRHDEVGVLVDGQRVDIRRRRIGPGPGQQLGQCLRGDQVPGQTNHDDAARQVRSGEQALALDDRFSYRDVLVQPRAVERHAVHTDSVPVSMSPVEILEPQRDSDNALAGARTGTMPRLGVDEVIETRRFARVQLPAPCSTCRCHLTGSSPAPTPARTTPVATTSCGCMSGSGSRRTTGPNEELTDASGTARHPSTRSTQPGRSSPVAIPWNRSTTGGATITASPSSCTVTVRRDRRQPSTHWSRM